MPEHTIVLELVDHTRGVQLEPLLRRLDRLEAVLDDHDDTLASLIDRMTDAERYLEQLRSRLDATRAIDPPPA